MSFLGIYETAGSAMSAQTVRLNTISSNLANADSVSGDPSKVYKPLKPIFSAVYNHFNAQETQHQGVVPIRIADVVEVSSMMEGRYEPNNPLSNDEGYVYYSGINVVNEMADMISATRSFEASVEVLGNVKSMQQSLMGLWRS
ncbi:MULTISPECIES: flagellar basal body rod protein FlgC [Vibrio]|jgi:flagellar basal-body rod protein FlgC|uniref:Flagellar basal-body rod protein FlgC n=3 Tax=Vibrio TaxID=662 RepID=A0A240EL01_9VIBR|nr:MULTISPECIES: flagellar basal body rod protein FlgC [Vibrio]ASI90221.1 flagellar basal body rod protein FlgC [Vibrio mediterranei]AYV22178.1 flagellar basal body rod protein FlgC [Vibrio mediterranei]EDL51968.1 flagellar basal-body rod protein C [Vibrio mediterranei AK1]KFA95782.1 flagellar basal body rod protein FlgC [Vibrio sp. ER1A]MCF4175827.1 flagellar basal body rod protein FlgC [Vibrio sp. McD22-P3]